MTAGISTSCLMHSKDQDQDPLPFQQIYPNNQNIANEDIKLQQKLSFLLTYNKLAQNQIETNKKQNITMCNANVKRTIVLYCTVEDNRH